MNAARTMRKGGDMLTQGSLKKTFGGMKQDKSMVILRDFPYNSVLFGLVFQ